MCVNVDSAFKKIMNDTSPIQKSNDGVQPNKNVIQDDDSDYVETIYDESQPVLNDLVDHGDIPIPSGGAPQSQIVLDSMEDNDSSSYSISLELIRSVVPDNDSQPGTMPFNHRADGGDKYSSCCPSRQVILRPKV